MLLVSVAILVIVVGCLSSYIISRPMLTKYLKLYVLTYFKKEKEKEDQKTTKETSYPKPRLGLSIRQVLTLDNEDDPHDESIPDKFHQAFEISDAVREAGLEQSNVIIGVDFSASNEWQGRQSFEGKSLHYTSKKQRNPYQEVMTIIPDILEPFDDDNLIPVFGFGDSTTKDRSVFPFKPDGSPCHGFREVLEQYERVKKQVQLSGPTSLVPIINKAVELTVKAGGYHILLVIMDGQIEADQDESTQFAIVEASLHPLSIIVVGVGDGPFDRMHSYDDKLPARQFDNFHFVDYYRCIAELKESTTRATSPEMFFALHTLMEIPDQYKKIKSLGMLPDKRLLSPLPKINAETRRRKYSQARHGSLPRNKLLEMEPRLSKEEIAECKEAFDVFDQNKDGKITTKELTKVLQSLGSLPTKEEIRAIINDYDLDKNGTIEFPEFLNMVSQKSWMTKEIDSEKETKKAFRAFDKNGDGFITASELKEAMIRLGESVTDEEVDEMFKEADLNHDSLISYDEFVKMMK